MGRVLDCEFRGLSEVAGIKFVGRAPPKGRANTQAKNFVLIKFHVHMKRVSCRLRRKLH